MHGNGVSMAAPSGAAWGHIDMRHNPFHMLILSYVIPP